MQAMVESLDTDIEFIYIQNADPKRNDEIMRPLPEGSVIVNATGMGKDAPGSPISDRARFPKNGFVWDFNYRGDLDFLRQAGKQKHEQNLWVEDGWIYFIHGWTRAMAEVFHIDIPTEGKVFEDLCQIAAQVR